MQLDPLLLWFLGELLLVSLVSATVLGVRGVLGRRRVAGQGHQAEMFVGRFDGQRLFEGDGGDTQGNLFELGVVTAGLLEGAFAHLQKHLAASPGADDVEMGGESVQAVHVVHMVMGEEDGAETATALGFEEAGDGPGFIGEGEAIDDDDPALCQEGDGVHQGVAFAGEDEDLFGNSFPVHTFPCQKFHSRGDLSGADVLQAAVATQR